MRWWWLVLLPGLAAASIQPRTPAHCGRVVLSRALARPGAVVTIPKDCAGQAEIPPPYVVREVPFGVEIQRPDGAVLATIPRAPQASPPSKPTTRQRRTTTYWTTITTDTGRRERAQVTIVEEDSP